MFAVRSLVLGALLSVWQHVKCQNQEFPMNPAFVPISTLSRSLRNSRIISSQRMNQPNLYDPMKYDNNVIAETDQNTNSNSNMNMNANRNFNGPMSWHQSKSMSKIRERRVKNHRPHNFRKKHSTTNVEKLLQLIDPQLSANLDLNSPYPNDSPLQLFGRRNAVISSHEDSSDNELVCHNSVENILLKMRIIKDNIQDIENEIIDCVGTSETSVF